jgi:hypothetical protein
VQQEDVEAEDFNLNNVGPSSIPEHWRAYGNQNGAAGAAVLASYPSGRSNAAGAEQSGQAAQASEGKVGVYAVVLPSVGEETLIISISLSSRALLVQITDSSLYISWNVSGIMMLRNFRGKA